ncbi:MAG: hypothetical protein J0I14_07375 [Propionibacteriaceae bacterium]|nr:hypothetical protein [Propionibacteriaceae bacterium]
MADTLTSTDPTLGSTTDPTVGFRRVAGAIALPLSFALQLVCNTIYLVIQTESGLNDTGSAAEALEMTSRYPAQFTIMSLLAFAGSLVLVPGALAALRVLRPSAPRLALWAAVSLIAGYFVYGASAMRNADHIGLSVAGLGPDVASALDANPFLGAFQALMILFLWGNLVGPILLGIAVIRSRSFRWYVGALVMAWSVLHPVGLVLGTEAGAVLGGVLQIVGCAFLAARALRTSDTEWAARG